jgi:hypothetical protein
MSCKCCAGPCRKKVVKKRGGKKQKKAAKQPVVSISLGQPQAQSMPRLAPTFQSSINTPLSEQKVTGSPMIKVPSRITGISREIETQTTRPTMAEAGIQTVQLAGRASREEQQIMNATSMSLSDVRIGRRD